MRTVPEGAKVVQVVGQQWSWSFVYPEEGLTSDRLFLPVNKPVKLELTSRDVIHSFYLPAFRVKEDTVPGMVTYLNDRARRIPNRSPWAGRSPPRRQRLGPLPR